MKKATVLISILVHGGFAIALFTAQQKRAAGRTHTIQVTSSEKKKKIEAPKPTTPKPPKVAKVDPRPKEAKAAPVAKAPVEAPPEPKYDLAALGEIAMSNEDIGDAVAIPVARPVQAAVPAKVASIGQDPRRRRIGRDLGAGPNLDEPCSEEPSKPEPVYKTEIEYTSAARAEGIEGKLKIKVIVGAAGEVLSVVVLSSVSSELDAAAVASVKQWRFKPAMACGKPVAGGSYILARRFELGD